MLLYRSRPTRREQLASLTLGRDIWKYSESGGGLFVAISEIPFNAIFTDYSNVNDAAEIWTSLITKSAMGFIPCHQMKVNQKINYG